jgi:hypothetical protein
MMPSLEGVADPSAGSEPEVVRSNMLSPAPEAGNAAGESINGYKP